MILTKLVIFFIKSTTDATNYSLATDLDTNELDLLQAKSVDKVLTKHQQLLLYKVGHGNTVLFFKFVKYYKLKLELLNACATTG